MRFPVPLQTVHFILIVENTRVSSSAHSMNGIDSV